MPDILTNTFFIQANRTHAATGCHGRLSGMHPWIPAYYSQLFWMRNLFYFISVYGEARVTHSLAGYSWLIFFSSHFSQLTSSVLLKRDTPSR